MTQQGAPGWPLVGVGLIASAAVWGLWAWAPQTRRRSAEEPMPTTRHEPIWPILFSKLTKIGDSIASHRPGSGRAHKGVDLFTEAGTEVRAAVAGRVLRVINGSKGSSESQQRAGLFVDVADIKGTRVYRYLHLGRALVKEGQRIRAADVIGTVAATGTSGVMHSSPHLHFEIRDGDFDRERGDYGTPINPLTVLPLRFGASNGLG